MIKKTTKKKLSNLKWVLYKYISQTNETMLKIAYHKKGKDYKQIHIIVGNRGDQKTLQVYTV